MHGFFITGTDTDVGKTWITALLTLGLRRLGRLCCPVKPIATGGICSEGSLVSPDALLYQNITGIDESPRALNPFCLERAASPHFISAMEKAPIPFADIHQHLSRLAQRYEILLVEGIGGWLVPLADNCLVADFAIELGLPVLVVSANRLGAINHTLLTLEAMRARGVEPAGVIFNSPHPDVPADLQQNNLETITRLGQVQQLGACPFIPHEILEKDKQEALWKIVENTIAWKSLLQLLATR